MYMVLMKLIIYKRIKRLQMCVVLIKLIIHKRIEIKYIFGIN